MQAKRAVDTKMVAYSNSSLFMFILFKLSLTSTKVDKSSLTAKRAIKNVPHKTVGDPKAADLNIQ